MSDGEGDVDRGLGARPTHYAQRPSQHAQPPWDAAYSQVHSALASAFRPSSSRRKALLIANNYARTRHRLRGWYVHLVLLTASAPLFEE